MSLINEATTVNSKPIETIFSDKSKYKPTKYIINTQKKTLENMTTKSDITVDFSMREMHVFAIRRIRYACLKVCQVVLKILYVRIFSGILDQQEDSIRSSFGKCKIYIP